MLGIKWLENREDKWRHFESEAMPLLPDLFRTAMWLARNRDEAEDLVQETMFQAMRSFHSYQMGTNCKAWLTRILYVQNVRRLQKVLRLKLVQDVDDEIAHTIPFEPQIPQEIADEEVIAAIGRLPDIYRIVLVLADVEELSYKEISSIMDIPMGTVMSRLSRGRRVLRIELADYASRHGFGDQERAGAR